MECKFVDSPFFLSFQAQSDGGLHMVMVIEPRYTRPVELPVLNKWQQRMCAKCGVIQTTGGSQNVPARVR